MSGLSAFVQRRWGSWGILLLSLLGLVLAVWSFANLLLLSAVIESGSQTDISQGQIWTIFILNALFGLTFAASAYGLWRRRNWGRLLFIGCIIGWSVFFVTALFTPGSLPADYTAGALILNIIPLIAAIAAILYLNLAHIKALFDNKAAANEQIGESVNQ